MFSSFNNMPRNSFFMQPRRNPFGFPRRNDFFFPRRNDFFFPGNNFFVPFLLGGITGAALSNQPFYGPYSSNFYYNSFYPYPF